MHLLLALCALANDYLCVLGRERDSFLAGVCIEVLGLSANHVPILINALVVLVHGAAYVFATLCGPLHEVVGLVAVAGLQVHYVLCPLVLAVGTCDVAVFQYEATVGRDAGAGQALSGHVVVEGVVALLSGIDLHAGEVGSPQSVLACHNFYLHGVGLVLLLLQFQHAVVSSGYERNFATLLFAIDKQGILALCLDDETDLLVLVVVHRKSKLVDALAIDDETGAVCG